MHQKVIVITGASSGIGEAAAVRLSSDQHSLALVARRPDVLQEVADRCAGRARAIPGDMTSRDEVRRVVREALAAFGRIDVWINNVGQGITRPTSELTDEDVELVMRVNVMSALYGMQEVLPHFKSRGEGHIVNISSMLGRIPWAPMRSAYCGAKHFLNAITATLRDEVRETHPGIRITLVSPGVVRTNFGRNALHGGPDSSTLPDSQSAGEVADVIASVVAVPVDDVYTRTGARERIARYFATTGQDPG